MYTSYESYENHMAAQSRWAMMNYEHQCDKCEEGCDSLYDSELNPGMKICPKCNCKEENIIDSQTKND